MADFPGVIATPPRRAVEAQSSNLSAGSYSWVPQLQKNSSRIFGTRSAASIPGVVSNPKTGSLAKRFYDLYYNRIHLIPQRVDAGIVITTIVRSVEAWNAYTVNRTLNSITPTNNQGVTLGGQSAPPLSFGPLQSRFYTLTIDSLGPAGINATFTFAFDSGESPLLSVTGSRLIAFTFEPNWVQVPTERLAWLTDVLRSHSGLEQRVRVRSKPRRSIEYFYTLETAHKQDSYQSLIFNWQHRIFAVPTWMDRTTLTAQASVGAITISVASTTNLDFEVNGLGIILRDYQTYEVFEIQGILSNSITLKNPLQQTWANGLTVIPLRTARMEPTFEEQALTSSLMQTSLLWSLEPEQGMGTNRVGVWSGSTYQGKDVFSDQPDWIKPRINRRVREYDLIDSNTGVVSSIEKAKGPEPTWAFRKLLTSRSDISRFLGWLNRMKGRLVTFWIPTWRMDLEMVTGLGPTDTQFQIRDVQYRLHVNQHLNRRNIAFIDTRGNIEFIRMIIASIAGDPGNERLTIDSALGVSRNPSDFSMLCYLLHLRLDQDSIEMTWHTDSLVEVSLSLREVLL